MNALPPQALVALEGVTKSFGDGEARVDVLRGVDFELAAGETCAVLGPSGSGKSTLLNIIGTLEPPSSGRVVWEGKDLARADADERAAFRNREIGFVFQRHHLLPQCTALENVLLPTLASASDRHAELEARAGELLERVGLGHRRSHRPSQMSGGECQRVAVVRALIHRPRLVLADEPTGSLDGAAAESLGDLFLELNEGEGVTLVVVTHSEALAARMGRIARIADGRVSTGT